MAGTQSASVSYGKATPYFSVIDLLKRYAHIEERRRPARRPAKLTGQVLTLDEALQGVIPALLALLDALPEDSPFLDLDPSQRRQRILDACKRLLLRESQVQPLLLVFEDLHWIDTATQAFSTICSTVCRAPVSFSWSIIAQTTCRAGDQADYTHCDSIRSRRRVLTIPPRPGRQRCRPGTAQTTSDRMHGRQSVFSGGERPGRWSKLGC